MRKVNIFDVYLNQQYHYHNESILFQCACIPFMYLYPTITFTRFNLCQTASVVSNLQYSTVSLYYLKRLIVILVPYTAELYLSNTHCNTGALYC